MPSNETYRSQFESPSQRWRDVPKAVRNLYRSPEAFAFYQRFKDMYTGDPYLGTYPDLVRDRGGHTIVYDREVLSAISARGNHMLHIRAGRDTTGSPLDDRLKFFVVTGDFNTYHETEWFLSDVRANGFGQPSRLELFLSHNPVNEAPPLQPDTAGMGPLDELDALWQRDQEQLDADAESMRYFYENNRSFLSWGDGRAPSTFHSLSEAEAGLYLLYQAEKQGQLGDVPVGHEGVIQHLERAA